MKKHPRIYHECLPDNEKVQKTLQNTNFKRRIEKAGELTSIFLDTRKLLNAEYNVIDQKTDISGKTGDGSIASKIKISRGT